MRACKCLKFYNILTLCFFHISYAIYPKFSEATNILQFLLKTSAYLCDYSGKEVQTKHQHFISTGPGILETEGFFSLPLKQLKSTLPRNIFILISGHKGHINSLNIGVLN